MAVRPMFSVYDSPAKAYLPPFVADTEKVALRMFEAACRDSQHQFARFAEDYTLFLVGEFDDFTGQVIELTKVEKIAGAWEVIAWIEEKDRGFEREAAEAAEEVQ